MGDLGCCLFLRSLWKELPTAVTQGSCHLQFPPFSPRPESPSLLSGCTLAWLHPGLRASQAGIGGAGVGTAGVVEDRSRDSSLAPPCLSADPTHPPLCAPGTHGPCTWGHVSPGMSWKLEKWIQPISLQPVVRRRATALSFSLCPRAVRGPGKDERSKNAEGEAIGGKGARSGWRGTCVPVPIVHPAVFEPWDPEGMSSTFTSGSQPSRIITVTVLGLIGASYGKAGTVIPIGCAQTEGQLWPALWRVPQAGMSSGRACMTLLRLPAGLNTHLRFPPVL